MQSVVRSFAHRGPFVRAVSTLRPFSMSAAVESDPKPAGESTATSSTSTPASSSTSTPASQKEQLALPETAHNSTTQLDMSNGGTTVKLDHLGPMVVNVDGSLSQISNWERMADVEKKNTLRIIGKRNQARLEALRAKEGGN